MSPDSPLGKVAQRVSALEQRVEDLVRGFTERLSDLAGEVRSMRKDTAEDIRAFGPLVQEHHEIKAEMRFVHESMDALLAAHAALDKRMDDEREQRIAGQEDRRRELREAHEAAMAAAEAVKREAAEALRDAITEREKQTRELKNRVTLGVLVLFGGFLTSGATLLAAILGGTGHGG
jgi:predicted phage tail protein